jgi:pilus assembly protein TadC
MKNETIGLKFFYFMFWVIGAVLLVLPLLPMNNGAVFNLLSIIAATGCFIVSLLIQALAQLHKIYLK